ncbi:MAG: ATP-binding protein [Candidatus Zixiibacteriota bacterium]
MLVYSRRHGSIEIRPAWVIGMRLVTLAVTAAVARPLWTDASLHASVLVYAGMTAVAVLALLSSRRRHRPILLPTALALQTVCEILVISQVVYLTGGLRSPSHSLYMMTIVSAALCFRLAGTLVVAAVASASFVTAIWVGAGHQAGVLWSRDWFAAMRQLSDQDFYTVFLRLCIFFLCAFAGGYLAERLHTKDKALAHTSEALQLAKWETGDILKHLRSGVLTLDIAGHIAYFNRAAEEILGLTERRVRGRPIREILGAHYPELADRLEWVLASQQMDIRTELLLRRPDGRVIPVGLSTSVLSGTGGRPRGVIAVFADLTEAKQLEERARRQDRLAAVGELSAAIAHEIRNPLAAISGSVEVLRSELDVADENRKLLELIIAESARLNKILSDFLLYARLSPVVTGRVCVATALDEVLEIARRHFRRNDGSPPVDLRTDVADRALTVAADPDHLKQMLINLVFNAVEACADRPCTVTVRVRSLGPTPEWSSFREPVAGNGDDWVTIAVVDNGGGIPDSVMERLYEPFVSSKPSGTGLGLAIVKRLVDSAGGRIHAESTPGLGTTFTVHLKRCPMVAPTRAAV